MFQCFSQTYLGTQSYKSRRRVFADDLLAQYVLVFLQTFIQKGLEHCCAAFDRLFEKSSMKNLKKKNKKIFYIFVWIQKVARFHVHVGLQSADGLESEQLKSRIAEPLY